MPNDVRTCGQDCQCYDSKTGTCRLYSVLTNQEMIKRFKDRAYEGESCNYGLLVGEDLPHTPQQFLVILHSRADPFLAFPSARHVGMSDINPEILRGLEQTAQPQLQAQH